MAEKYQHILSTLHQSSSYSESNERVTSFFVRLGTAGILIESFRNIQALMEPFSYITSTPGKDFRGGMMQAFNAWLHVPESKLQVIGHVISMLHNASLLYVPFFRLSASFSVPDPRTYQDRRHRG
jgi:geranylgeranyl diphosphate synthase type 3